MSEQTPIEEHHQRHGGPAGILGVPIGEEEEIGDAIGGRRRSFRAELIGTRHRFSVPIPTDVPDSTCHNPDVGPRTVLESSIVWSQETGAHAVHGEIRRRWLELGAESGKLGYPLSEEQDTPDGLGRRTVFQGGEIWWTPASGAEVQPPS
jgi:uncharacterized protein with LGFP repeats